MKLTDMLHFLDRIKLQVLGSILILCIGILFIRIVLKLIDQYFDKYNVNVSMRSFLKGIIKLTLRIMLVITIAAYLEIPMTTFIAMLSAAGLAIALALKDNLTNFSSGIMIILFKPFQVGDFIETQGSMGKVQDIQLLYTYLLTPDNRKIIVPNSELTNNRLTNFSTESTRRVDLVFGVGYDDDIMKVKETLTNIVNSHKKILETPEPLIKVCEHAESSINFAVRVWCASEDYWTVYFDLYEQVKIGFDKENITIPYPQQDVHLIQKK